MNYDLALQYIEEKNKLGIVPGLDNIKELLTRLGNPQDKCRCLHIAGTNGKGSVFSYVQDVLMEEGYTVGRYISPTIFTYLERFSINKQNIDEDLFAKYLTEVAHIVDKMVEEGFHSPSAFEIETAIMFLYFEREKVDFVLVECGMGGLLDATNVIRNPFVVAFAGISMDHMNFLGDSITKIAQNKAGIIKEGCLCVSSPQVNVVKDILAETCEKMKASIKIVSEGEINCISSDISGSTFNYKGHKYKISLLGEHQLVNAATAIEVIFAMRSQGIVISDDSISRGLLQTIWPGRMTVMRKNPYVIVDGAHNVAAWESLTKSINKYFTNREIIYIIGVLRDKEYDKMVDIFSDNMKLAITVTPDNKRALEKEVLADIIRSHNIEAYTAKTSCEALEIALAKATEDDVILVCGSLSFIAEYLNGDRYE